MCLSQLPGCRLCDQNTQFSTRQLISFIPWKERENVYALRYLTKHTVVCCLKAGTVESDRKLISWTTASIPRQRLGKQLLSLQRIASDKIKMKTLLRGNEYCQLLNVS
jgi:hypothetical protein